MGGFSNPKFNEKEEGLEQDVVIPEFVDKNVQLLTEDLEHILWSTEHKLYW